jgi:DGQHR domain-containing protein
MKLKSTAVPTYDIYAIKGEFNGVTYFMATLSLAQCVEQLHIENVNEVKSFKERMQRTLDEDRAFEIYDKYLKRDRLRFFNSLVAVMVPPKGEVFGYYEFTPFEDDKGRKLPLGLLKVQTDIQRIVVDGQHRWRALKHASEYVRTEEYNEILKLKELEIPIVLLAFKDVEGNDFTKSYSNIYEKVTERARTVFVDLNKNAKRADKKSLFVLDDSDFSAVVARHLIENDDKLERFTRWHGNGSALPDSDHCFTTIELLSHFVEVLIGEDVEEQISVDYELSDDTERERAINEWFLSSSSKLFGLAPAEIVSYFFHKLEYFADWPASIELILGSPPAMQPQKTEMTAAQKRQIKERRNKSLLGTVVGQKTAFAAICEALPHMGSDDAHVNLAIATSRINILANSSFYSKTTGLWEELLTRPGGKMKLTAQDSAKRLLSYLIQLTPIEKIEALIETWLESGDATTSTSEAYKAAQELLCSQIDASC